MLFLPYKLDISIYRVPLLTILVCLICLATFLFQRESGTAFARNLRYYCNEQLDANLHAIIEAIDDEHVGHHCANVFFAIRQSSNRDKEISMLAGEVRNLEFYRDRAADLKYKEDTLKSGYADFEALVPDPLTDKLAYKPDRYDFVTMMTSTFAHSSWEHILGNLFFFFIFASCVECIVGPIQFCLIFVLMAVTTSLAYSYSSSAADALPTIGLSGVAMGMMAMLTALLPQARIWCIFWFLLFVRRFTLPVFVIALWYIGWNVYDLQYDHSSHINYMAHVSGAITGLVLGALYRLFAPQRLDAVTVGAGDG